MANIFSTTLTNGADDFSFKGWDVDIPWTIYALAGNDKVTVTGGWETICYMGLGDDIAENRGADFLVVHGEEGNDRLDVFTGGGSLDGGDGVDTANIYGGLSLGFSGGAGNDLVNFFADVLTDVSGDDGADRFFGNRHGIDGTIRGGNDNDTFYNFVGAAAIVAGGAGNDVYRINSNSLPTILENSGEGSDTVVSTVSMTLPDNVERLTLAGSGNIGGTGNGLANLIVGNAGANALSGDDGNDRLLGGAGKDEFWGGAGADAFLFKPGDFAGIDPATCDIIHDFSIVQRDRIRLDYVDANTGAAGDQAFAFIGSETFHGVAGELRYEQVSGNTYVEGDVNGDGLADFMIALDGTYNLTSGNFVL